MGENDSRGRKRSYGWVTLHEPIEPKSESKDPKVGKKENPPTLNGLNGSNSNGESLGFGQANNQEVRSVFGAPLDSDLMPGFNCRTGNPPCPWNTTPTPPRFPLLGDPLFGTGSFPATATATASGFEEKLKKLNDDFVSAVLSEMAKNPSCCLLPLVKDYMRHTQKLASQERDNRWPTRNKNNQSLASVATLQQLGEFFDQIGPTQTEYRPTPQPVPVTQEKEIMTSSSLTNNVAAGMIQNDSCDQNQRQMDANFNNDNNDNEDDNENGAEDPEPEDDENQETEENQPKPLVTEHDAIFQCGCKLFQLVDGKDYKSKGVGTLYLKLLESGNFQLVVRADSALGPIILNTALTRETPFRKIKPKDLLLIIPTQNSGGGDKKSSTFLFRTSSESDCEQLLEKTNSN